MKDYDKLDKTANYDQEKVEELAEAMMELRELTKRCAYLQELIKDNSELGQFIWGTAEGKLIPHHKIELDHFNNILNHLTENGREVSKALRSEAKKRGVEVPEVNKVKALERVNIYDINEDYDPIFEQD